MSGPYRESGGDLPLDAPRDEGIVGDVIAQFADIHAFYRELVQNSIDAGSPSVEVELEYSREEQRMSVAVKDRGEGMTRDIVENQLLVLFRSTKEKDESKIGKFGIGFASVLAPNPEVVKVATVRDKRKLMLHLYRDLSYELFDAGFATQNGTTVTLELAMKATQVDDFTAKSREALRRWCRHATVPIELVVLGSEGPVRERIDSPLELASTLVEVRETSPDGLLTVVVGLGAPYVGFFNHGLMLYETTEPLVGTFAAKIQDARLGHTISRDDVRRDEHFDNAIAFARRVAQHSLAKQAATMLEKHARASDSAKAEALVSAVVAAELKLPAWYLPLVETVEGDEIIDVAPLRRGWGTRERSPLTAELAGQATRIIQTKDFDALAADLERATGFVMRDVHAELTSVKPVERSEKDEALLVTLGEILDKVYRDPGAVVLAQLIGINADRFAIAGTANSAHVVDRDAAARNPFALLGRRPLVLSTEHPLVQAARAHDDPRLAAAHLARAVLLHHRLLDADRSQQILDIALAHSGVE